MSFPIIKRVFTGVMLLLFCLVSLAAWSGMVWAKEKNKKTGTVQVKKAVPVEVMEARYEDLPSIVESVGRLYPNRQVTVSAQLPGVVKRYYADIGDAVKKGKVLIEIDPSDYQLGYDEAKAGLTAAEAGLFAATKAFERAKKLLPRQVISPGDFERAEAEFKGAEASEQRAKVGLKAARERLKKTRITAPFSSLVAALMVEEGQMVGGGVPVMILVDLSQVRVLIHLAERQYVKLDQDDPVEVKVDAFPDKVYKGKVDRIGITADAATNTFPVEILISNPELALKPGLSARVSVTLEVLSGVILIPQSTVLHREKGTTVFILQDDKTVSERIVKLGVSKGDLIQVLEGISPGEKVVTKGQNYIKNGDRVMLP